MACNARIRYVSILFLFLDLDDRPSVIRAARRARVMRAHKLAAPSARRQVRHRYFPALRPSFISSRFGYFTFRADSSHYIHLNSDRAIIYSDIFRVKRNLYESLRVAGDDEFLVRRHDKELYS